MAIIYQASLTPTKQELLARVLGGPVEVVATYRFDDPAGEVGVEGFVVRRGGELEHAVLTYRGAPFDGARLISTMEHSVLGRRWVYDAGTDPVALGCFRRALLGQQDQAVLEVWADGERVEVREPSVELLTGAGPAATAVTDRATVQLRRELGAPSQAGATLTATWHDGAAVVAELVALAD